MLLRNSREFLSSIMGMSIPAIGESTQVTYGGKVVKDYFGSCSLNNSIAFKSLLEKIMDFSTYIKDGANNYMSGVVFGTGNTPPTSDDYTLSGSGVDGLSNSNITYVISYENSETTRSIIATYTITNSTGADITIGEVGLVCTLYGTRSGYTSGSYYPILVERTVLDSPVTIPADGVGQVTYTIRMNYPV